jgi:hypothetical protein
VRASAFSRRTSAASAPDCDPFLDLCPLRWGGCAFPAPAAAASLYSSAILVASLKILTNIGRVSFPVWVFWLEGW